MFVVRLGAITDSKVPKIPFHPDYLASPKQAIAHAIGKHPSLQLHSRAGGHLRFIPADDISTAEDLDKAALLVTGVKESLPRPPSPTHFSARVAAVTTDSGLHSLWTTNR